VVSGLEVELRALRDSDPGMSLLSAVEYTTSDPAHRIALYRLCSPEDRDIRFQWHGSRRPPSFEDRLVGRHGSRFT
jgi:hypothetical protein